jgi:hypothetical protein
MPAEGATVVRAGYGLPVQYTGREGEALGNKGGGSAH